MTNSRLRTLAAAAASSAVLLAGLAPAPASAATPVPADVRSGLGHADPPHRQAWWYDALHLAQAHRITTGRGATVAVVGEDDFSLDVPELKGADVHLEKDCRGGRARSKSIDIVTDHGTRMAAYIAGTGRGPDPGGLGTLGVAPGARVELWPTSYDCSDAQVRRQVVEAARHGADIISLSDQYGGDWGPTVREINKLGAVLVAAAGNGPDDGTEMILPARTRGVVGVQAVDKQAHAWKGNTWVTESDLKAGSGYPVIAAPGVQDDGSGWFKGYGWSHGRFTGTSESTAFVSGMLALVKSRYPDATADQLTQQLIHYVGGFNGHFGWDVHYGFGIASAAEMLKHDPTQWPDENPLWLTPYEAIKTYPMSVRGQKHVLETPSASPSAAASTGASRQTGPRQTAATTSSGGVPVGVWVALVTLLVVLGGGAAAVAVRRRGPATSTNSTTDPDRQKQGV